MSQSRVGVKIDVHLVGIESPFSHGQHTYAIITDLATGRKFDIDYPIAEDDTQSCLIHSAEDETLAEERLRNECLSRTATIYSDKDFDTFVTQYNESKFADGESFNPFCNNCADAVTSAIDYFCPERANIDAFYCTYKVLCFLPFIGSLGLKCFPSLFCTTPSDTFDLAVILSYTTYGKPPLTPAGYQALPGVPEMTRSETKSDAAEPLLSAQDRVSASIITSNTGLSLVSRPKITFPTRANIELMSTGTFPRLSSN